MLNCKKNLLKALVPLSFFLFSNKLKAQPPLFSGYKGKEYSFELRLNDSRDLTGILKTFRNKIPAWGYVGEVLHDGEVKPFYGLGSIFHLGPLHTLPTVEGYDKKFLGISGYSTLDLFKGFYLDFVPHINRDFKYGGIELTIHKDFKGITLGASSVDNHKNFKDLYLQLGKFTEDIILKGNINPSTKKWRLDIKKNFR